MRSDAGAAGRCENLALSSLLAVPFATRASSPRDRAMGAGGFAVDSGEKGNP